MRRTAIVPAACLLAACAVEEPALATATAPVVYGEDDRTEVYAVEDPVWRARATRSAMVLASPNRLQVDPEAGTVEIEASIYGEHFNLCPDQPFFAQRRLGQCSGTLVDTDVVLTAGHCMPTPARCADRRLVFGWYLAEADTPPRLRPEDIYACAEILLTVNETRAGRRLDHAFVRLDRAPPAPFEPAPLRAAAEALPLRTPVTLIGFPNGLPAKVAAGGAVVNARADRLDFFEATVDAFGGNSGSGVYTDDGRLAGVLARGAQDHRETDAGCSVVNVLPQERSEEEGGEDVSYVAQALEDLCLTGYRGDHLCAPGEQGWCFPCLEDADCRAGWSCRSHREAPDLRFCSAPCAEDADCRGDHACVEGGCAPRLAPACVGPDVWDQDACRRPLALRAACPADQRCAAGVCAPAPPGDRCGAATPIEARDQRLEGDLRDYGAFADGTCAGRGPERVFAFQLDRPRPFEATATGFDTVLHLRRGCALEELACVDDSDPPGGRGSRIAADLPPGDYLLFMDSYGDSAGEYVLDLRFGAGPCDPVDCALGAARCGPDDRPEACAADEAGCPRWAPAEACPPGTACADGRCQPPDAGPLDQGTSDATPDLGADLALPDLALPDLALPDLAPPDLALPDLAPDRATPDLAPDPPADAAPEDGGRPDRAPAPPAPARGGCAQSPGPSAPWAALLLGVALGAHRRRRGTDP